MKIERITFGGWPNCYRLLCNGLELVVTTDVGPRVIRAGFQGKANLFKVYPKQLGKTGGETWTIYGGHRLWHSPEEKGRTYQPDNWPVRVDQNSSGIVLKQPLEVKTGIEKSIELIPSESEPGCRVIHRLKNCSLWPVRCSVWAISVMEPGGFAVSPMACGLAGSQLLPNRTLTLWPYTDLRDSRFRFGKDIVLVRQQKGTQPTKLGVNNDQGWAAYCLPPFVFLKRFEFQKESQYPDFGSSLEIYTNSEMLELETIGPLRELEPGQETAHEETWSFLQDIDLEFSEESVTEKLIPELSDCRRSAGLRSWSAAGCGDRRHTREVCRGSTRPAEPKRLALMAVENRSIQVIPHLE